MYGNNEGRNKGAALGAEEHSRGNKLKILWKRSRDLNAAAESCFAEAESEVPANRGVAVRRIVSSLFEHLTSRISAKRFRPVRSAADAASVLDSIHEGSSDWRIPEVAAVEGSTACVEAYAELVRFGARPKTAKRLTRVCVLAAFAAADFGTAVKCEKFVEDSARSATVSDRAAVCAEAEAVGEECGSGRLLLLAV